MIFSSIIIMSCIFSYIIKGVKWCFEDTCWPMNKKTFLMYGGYWNFIFKPLTLEYNCFPWLTMFNLKSAYSKGLARKILFVFHLHFDVPWDSFYQYWSWHERAVERVSSFVNFCKILAICWATRKIMFGNYFAVLIFQCCICI